MSEPLIVSLRDKVYVLMAELPAVKVITCGDLAAMAGCPYVVRIVRGVAQGGPVDLPWYRLVSAKGGLVAGFSGGQAVQRQQLEQEGIECGESWRIMNFKEKRWQSTIK